MKAIVLTQPGGTDKLQISEIPEPVPQPHEVLVKTKAIAVNPVDIKTRLGLAMYSRMQEEPPVILGWDIAGEVSAVGENAGKFKVGDEVFGMVNFPGHGKAYAELVTAPVAHLAIKPQHISWAEAAAGSLAALTAWQVLVHVAKIKAGQRVFIHAAAGGVGHFAVQIAKHFGAYVIGTASEANAAFLKELGTDEHLDYNAVKFEKLVQNIDIVLDPLGGEITRRSLGIIKPKGHLISIVGGVKEEIAGKAAQSDIKVDNYLVQSNGKDMAQLAELMQAGKLKAHVSHQFAFNEVAKAHGQIQTGKTRGKIVLVLE